MSACQSLKFLLFFFNDTATTEIYTLSLHDALPIFVGSLLASHTLLASYVVSRLGLTKLERSEEHTSELQSPCNLGCRLLLEKKRRMLSCTHVLRSGWKSMVRLDTFIRATHTTTMTH